MASVFKRKDGERYLAGFYDHAGTYRTRSTRTTDKSAAKRIAAKWENAAALRREGVIDPRQEEMLSESQRSVELHLADYQAKLETGGSGERHVSRTLEMIRSIATKGEFTTAADISADGVNRFAAELKTTGRSARTIQSYLTAIKGFTGWLVSTGKLPSDPLATVQKPNPETDRRLERRMLRHEEWRWLRDATAAAEDRFGMSGAERVLLYETAIQTGLRSNELRSLTRGRLYLTAEKPYITCKAGSTKNRKEARQYILTDLANRLRVHIATKAPKAPVFSLPADYEMAAMLRTDLDDARKAWLHEARHDPEEFANREQSDFLNAKNHEGESLDFHALRHTCGGWLAMSGAHPKSIQSVMRHSSIVLTMDTYGHLIPGQEAETIARLSSLLGPDQPQTLRATGTTDAQAEKPALESTERSGGRSSFRALPCVEGTRPCEGDDTTTDLEQPSKSLRVADLGDGVRPLARGSESGTAGTRTQNQRIMSPALNAKFPGFLMCFG